MAPAWEADNLWLQWLEASRPVDGRKSYSRTPIQCVKGCGFPAAASYTIPVIFSTSGTKTSRPPRPQIKPTSGGRLALAYKAARTSVASTPLEYGEPREKSRSITPTALKRDRH